MLCTVQQVQVCGSGSAVHDVDTGTSDHCCDARLLRTVQLKRRVSTASSAVEAALLAVETIHGVNGPHMVCWLLTCVGLRQSWPHLTVLQHCSTATLVCTAALVCGLWAVISTLNTQHVTHPGNSTQLMFCHSWTLSCPRLRNSTRCHSRAAHACHASSSRRQRVSGMSVTSRSVLCAVLCGVVCCAVYAGQAV